MIQLGNVKITAVRAFTREDWMTWGGSSKFEKDTRPLGVPWSDGYAPLVIDVEINGHEAQVVSGGESWELYVADMGVWTPCAASHLEASSQAEILGRLAMLRIDEKVLTQFFDWRGELSPEPFYFRPAPPDALVKRDPEPTPRRITLPAMPSEVPYPPTEDGVRRFTPRTLTKHTVEVELWKVCELVRDAVGAPKDAEVTEGAPEFTVRWEVQS